jgi:hypothetical protein
MLVNGKSMTQQACYLEALRIDPNDATAWSNLGNTLAAGEAILGGKSMTKQAFEALGLCWLSCAPRTAIGLSLFPPVVVLRKVVQCSLWSTSTRIFSAFCDTLVVEAWYSSRGRGVGTAAVGSGLRW